MNRALSSLLLCTILAPAAAADVIDLVPAADNTLYEQAAGTLSNGAGIYMFCGRSGIFNGNARKRSVLRFDLSGIPSGSVINSVSLTLTNNQPPFATTGTHGVGLHVLESDWGEGASDAGDPGGPGWPAATDDATWIHTFFATGFWSTPGGDFAAAASALQTVSGPGAYTWASATLAADVQAWLDGGAPNNGWLMKHASETPTNSSKRFGTREGSVPPILSIDFTPPLCGTNYCTGLPNSAGPGATISAVGSCRVADNNFGLVTTGLPPSVFGLFYYGPNQTSTAFGEGLRCVGGQVFRLPPPSGADGTGLLARTVDLTVSPEDANLVPSSTWNFQCWYRDVSGGSSGFNLSDGVEVLFY